MFDADSPSDAPLLQRASGELAVSVRVRDGMTVLDGLRQSGCLNARFPRGAPDGWMQVVSVNTSGGIAGGDHLESRLHVQAGARVTFAGQAAERIYRRTPGEAPARIRTLLRTDGHAEWLPQETILFNRCALDRRLEVEMNRSGSFLGLEMLVFGRAAMAETVEHAFLRDVISIRRADRLALHDSVRLDGAVAAKLRHPAIANGARAVATLVYVAPDAEVRIDAARAALLGADAGASAWDGMLVARIVAPDSAALRSVVFSVLAVLRDDRPPPRVWMC
jgi:urease accessory protein